MVHGTQSIFRASSIFRDVEFECIYKISPSSIMDKITAWTIFYLAPKEKQHIFLHKKPSFIFRFLVKHSM